MSISEPAKITCPFAETGIKNPIPPAANNTTGKAGFDKGFPERTMLPKASDGIPPSGMDFNGIFYDITNILRYMQAGGQPTFSTAMATAIGGYPKGAVVISNDGNTIYRNTVDSNSTDPNSAGAGWVSEQATETVLGMMKVATQAQVDAATDDTLAVTPKKLSKHYRQGNVVGVVSQAGSVPTGAIIERGRNANGYYVKYADGSAHCERILPSNTMWPLPMAFTNVNACHVTADGTGAIISTYSSFSSTSVGVNAFDLSGAPYNCNVSGRVAGRWFPE